jgi:apolipoprotein N-acyltransferase
VIPRREAFALAAGLVWGLGTPGFWAPLTALAGWAALSRTLRGDPVTDALRYLSAGAVTASFATAWLGPDLVDAGVEDGRWLAASWVGAAAAGRGMLGALVGQAVRRGCTRGAAFALGEGLWAALAPMALWLPLDPSLSLGLSPLWLAPAEVAGAGGLAATWAWVAGARHPLALAIGLGALAVGARPSADPTQGIDVAALQPASGPAVTDDHEARARLSEHLAALAATAHAEVLVGPESSWHLDESAWPDPRPTLLGAPGPRRQSAVLSVDRQPQSRVDKHLPTPGTERTVLTIGRDRLAKVDGARSIALGTSRVGVLICGEDLAPGGVADVLAERPTWLALMSNDSWSVSGAGAGARWHHAAAGRLAASTRRPVVRAALTGPSAIFDGRGRALAQTAMGQPGIAAARIAPSDPAWCGEDVSRWLGVGAGLALVSLGRRPTPARRSPS